MLLNGLQSPNYSRLLYEVQDVFTSERSSASLWTISSKQVPRKIRHHILDQFGNWSPSHVQPNGRLNLNIKPLQSAQQQFDLPRLPDTSTKVIALADTGAQMSVADWEVAKRMNLRNLDLLLPALSVSVADNANLELIGAHFINIYAHSGQSTSQLVYFAKDSW